MVILIGFEFDRFGVCFVLNVHVRSNKLCKRAKPSFCCRTRCVHDLFLPKIGSGVSYCIVLFGCNWPKGGKVVCVSGVCVCVCHWKSHKPNAMLHGAASLYAQKKTHRQSNNSRMLEFPFGIFFYSHFSQTQKRVCIVCTKSFKALIWLQRKHPLHRAAWCNRSTPINCSSIRLHNGWLCAGRNYHSTFQRNVHKLFLADDFVFFLVSFVSLYEIHSAKFIRSAYLWLLASIKIRLNKVDWVPNKWPLPNWQFGREILIWFLIIVHILCVRIGIKIWFEIFCCDGMNGNYCWRKMKKNKNMFRQLT